MVRCVLVDGPLSGRHARFDLRDPPHEISGYKRQGRVELVADARNVGGPRRHIYCRDGVIEAANGDVYQYRHVGTL